MFIQGCIVAIDAMGCQKRIAGKIISQGGDYVLAPKSTQGHLLDGVKEAFEQGNTAEPGTYSTVGKGHGRIEKRECAILRRTAGFTKKPYGKT
ncbi:MAG: ISAs1 family transposase [Bacteroidetes bacterium]|nr:ISAs1 family transposase [Bacteroidota bacterium]